MVITFFLSAINVAICIFHLKKDENIDSLKIIFTTTTTKTTTTNDNCNNNNNNNNTQLYVIAMMSLNNTLRKCTGAYKIKGKVNPS